MMFRAGAAVVLLGLIATEAQAQGANQPVQMQERIIISERPSLPAQPIRVQSAINLFLPGPTGESEDAVKLRDRARRAIYEMAGRECDLVREVLAKDCRLEAINVNVHRQFGQQMEGYQIMGTFSLQITLK